MDGVLILHVWRTPLSLFSLLLDRECYDYAFMSV